MADAQTVRLDGVFGSWITPLIMKKCNLKLAGIYADNFESVQIQQFKLSLVLNKGQWYSLLKH